MTDTEEAVAWVARLDRVIARWRDARRPIRCLEMNPWGWLLVHNAIILQPNAAGGTTDWVNNVFRGTPVVFVFYQGSGRQHDCPHARLIQTDGCLVEEITVGNCLTCNRGRAAWAQGEYAPCCLAYRLRA